MPTAHDTPALPAPHTRATTMFAACFMTCAAAAAPIVSAPDANGFRWCTVGDPGNRPTTASDIPSNPDARIGSVGYEFRMSQTEVSNSQWLEFVRAYSPFYSGDPTASGFIGYNIISTPSGYQSVPGREQYPAVMEWRMAARYCNWLTNGKGTSLESFESGAYDTSTFTINPNGTFNDQATHTPGAAYWIPTEDEWVKAVYWDSNRYGQNQGGYWRQPYMSDSPAISGLPSQGGQTNGGLRIGEDDNAINVGSYPLASTPWGLLDASGGASEWTEKMHFGRRDRQVRGSRAYSAAYSINDLLEISALSDPRSPYGVRIASMIPATGNLSIFVAVCFATSKRKSR